MSRSVKCEQTKLTRIPVFHSASAAVIAFFINYIEAMADRTSERHCPHPKHVSPTLSNSLCSKLLVIHSLTFPLSNLFTGFLILESASLDSSEFPSRKYFSYGLINSFPFSLIILKAYLFSLRGTKKISEPFSVVGFKPTEVQNKIRLDSYMQHRIQSNFQRAD